MRVLAVALGLIPGGVVADCLTAADLKQGIVFTFDTAETETHFADRDGRTRVIWTEEGSVTTDILARGGLSLAYWDGSDKRGDNYARRVFTGAIGNRCRAPDNPTRFRVWSSMTGSHRHL